VEEVVMAKAILTIEEQIGFIPDVDDSKTFDFQEDVSDVEDFGFIADGPEELDTSLIDFTVDSSFKVAEDEQFDQVQFTSDVLSMPSAEIDPSEPPEGEFFEDPIGFKEAFLNKAGEPMGLLPFVGPLYSVNKMGAMVKAVKDIQNNPAPPKRGGQFGLDETPEAFASRQVDWMRNRYVVAEWVSELNERQERGVSIGGKVAEGILELPAFIIEFLLTAGVYEGASQGTKAVMAKVIKRSGEKVSKEFAEKVAKNTGIKLATKLGGALVGTAARTSAQVTRVAKSSLERLFPAIQVTEKGEVLLQQSQETPFSALAKGIGDVYIENLSEISGGVIGKAFSKIPFLGKFNAQLEKLFLKLNPSKTAADFVKTVGTKVGYNGFLEEIGEEQLGKVLRAATGVETFGAVQTGDKAGDLVARMVAAIPDGEELLVEAGIIAPLAALGIAGRVVSGRGEGGVGKVTKEGQEAELKQAIPAIEEVRTLKSKAQIEAFTEQSKKPIDRTADDAVVETQNRVTLVKNMSPAAQQEIADQSIDKVKSRISFKKPKVGIRQNFKDLLFKTDKAFRDEFAGLRRAVKAAETEGLDPADNPVELAVAFTQKSSAKTRGFVLEATTDLAGNRKSKGLKQIFSPLIKDGGKAKFEDFVTYLVAARDLNLQKQNKETGIDPVASQLTFDALDSPEFAQAAREVTEWNQKGIDLLVESGRITQESGQAIKESNPIYAPFFREFAEQEPQAGKGKGKKFVPKRLKGSQRKIVDPIEGMIQQMDSVIQSAQRAAIERSVANLAIDNPEAMQDFITPTKAPVAPTQFPVAEVKKQLEEIGIDFTGVKEEDLNELLTIFRPVSITQPGVIKLTVDGKNKFFKAEKELLEVLDGTETYKLGPFWDTVVGKPTRLLKLGATGLNTSFGLIRNPIRDIQTFTVTSEFAKAGPFSAVSGILKDVKTKASGVAENFGFNSLKPSSDVVKFAALGGEMSGFITQDRAGTRHIQHEMLASNGVRYTINTFRHPVDVLRNLVGITETGTRIGEFSAALKEGEKLYGKGSLSASVFALNAAQDVTTNFSRHGQIGKQINQMIPFFNAAIQGPDKLVRSFKERPLKSTIAAVSTLTVPAVFFWWRNKDKPWYQNMTAHEKSSYVHFEHPDNEDVVMRYPVPFELGHVFQAIPVAFLDAVYNERPEEIKEILQATLKNANPLDWPSLIGPIIDIKSNEDFAGRPIVSRTNEGKLPEDQFGPQTTGLMKAIGSAINMSPSQLEHLTNSYTGGIYNRVSRIIKSGDTEKQPSDMPIIGTLFVRDPFAPRKQIEAFYDERTLLNKKFNSKKITLNEALRRVVVNNFASVLNASFVKLREVETLDQRKAVWSDIEKILTFTDKIAPKE